MNVLNAKLLKMKHCAYCLPKYCSVYFIIFLPRSTVYSIF